MRLFCRWSFFYLCLFAVAPGLYISPVYAEESVSPKQELDHINAELKQLKDLKNKYQAAATRHEDEGMRLQFMEDYKQEARRAFQRADMEREMVQQIQVRIDYLEKQKATLLNQHPKLKEQGAS